MTIGFNEMVNDLEQRVLVLEQYLGLISHPLIDIEVDPDNNDAETVVDQLDWSVSAAWESYTQITPLPDTDPDAPGYASSTPYAPAAVHLVSGMCSLSGMVRRKTGVIAYTANTRATTANSPIFMLPDEWRPVTRVVLPCLLGNADPTTVNTAGVGMVEVRPETDTGQAAGIVYFLNGTIGLTPGTGWLALLGSFPCVRSSNEEDDAPEDSWNDVPDAWTWDGIYEGITWDSYPNSTS